MNEKDPVIESRKKLIQFFKAVRKPFLISGILMTLSGGLGIASGIQRDLGNMPIQTEVALGNAVSGLENSSYRNYSSGESDKAGEAIFSGFLFTLLGLGMIGTVVGGKIYTRRFEGEISSTAETTKKDKAA